MRIKATYVGLEIEFTRVQSKYTSECQYRLWKCKAPGARPKRRAKLLAGLGESSTKHVFTKTAVVVATVTGDVGVGSFSSAQWCCRPATTLGRGSPSNDAACFGSRRWLIGLHSSPLGALPPASHKRYSRLGWSIWRSLLGSVNRQQCGKIPLASEISWPAGSIGWRYVAAGGSPRGRDDRPMQVFQTKKPRRNGAGAGGAQ